MDKDTWCAGRFSKYITFLCESNADSLYKTLLNVASNEKCKPILFCTEDYYLHFLAEYSQELQEYYVMPESYVRNTIDVFLNKVKFYRMCMKHSVDLSPTYFPSDISEVKSISKEIHYPCVIKPALPHLWRKRLKGKKMVKVNKSRELVLQYDILSSIGDDLIIQEVVPGGDELIHVFGGYFNRDSKPLAVFTGRKLRQFPPRFGSASLAESLWNQEIVEKSVSILKKMKFHGICGAEFKLDPRSGTFRIMEINIRPTLWFSITDASGVNVVYLAYRDLADLPCEDLSNQEKYGKWIYFVRDFASSIYYMICGELSIKRWIESLRGVNAHAIYAGDDFSPVIFMPICSAKEFLSYFLLGG